MRLPDGVFCFERRAGEPAPLGRSPRYTLMVELGLLRARAAGYELPFDVDELRRGRLARARRRATLDAGRHRPDAVGRRAPRRRPRRRARASRLDAALARRRAASPARLGMELGWIVTGLAHHVAAGGSASRRSGCSRAALDQLLVPNRAPSRPVPPLRRAPDGAAASRTSPRRSTRCSRSPSSARYGLDDRALAAARATADRLLELQLPDGGWPWLFDAERGTVVERYEVYSVHQDAMAPMALLELSEVTRRRALPRRRGPRAALDPRRTTSSGADMVDRENGLVLRSIRRRRGPDRLWLAAKTGAVASPACPRRGSTARLTELNPTDRPYHFGWVLEAWCGREDVLAGAEVT